MHRPVWSVNSNAMGIALSNGSRSKHAASALDIGGLAPASGLLRCAEVEEIFISLVRSPSSRDLNPKSNRAA
jgi:hypothetical protein